MARREDQKGRVLALYHLLYQYTDDNHKLTMPKLLELLEHEGYPCDRRSVYSDLDALRHAGMEIEYTRGANGGYWLLTRPFELPELKLLADAVQSARFLTTKKARLLLKKLSGLGSQYQAQELRGQIYTVGRARTENEQVYYNVDTIQQAIAEGRRIRFSYFSYNAKKEKVYKYGGAAYAASPYGLCWDNENYYLVAWYDRRGTIVNFRVDRMERIRLSEQRAVPPPLRFRMDNYTQPLFGMFNGPLETVTLVFPERLSTAMFDRFGWNVTPHADREPGCYRLTAKVELSPAFLGWIFQFGGQVRILSPEKAVQMLTQYAEAVLAPRGD